MKTRKKLVSILCAAALLVSALPAAAAANIEPLSEFAGETIPVLVVDDTGDSTVSHVVNVAIPRGATKAKEDALVRSAALGQKQGVSPLSVNGSIHQLSVEYDFTVRSDIMKVGGGEVPSNCTISQVAVDIDLRSFDRMSAVLYLRVMNESTYKGGDWKFLSTDKYSDAEEIGSNPVIFRIFWYTNNGLPSFSAGDGMFMQAKMSTGNIGTINSLTTYAWY